MEDCDASAVTPASRVEGRRPHDRGRNELAALGSPFRERLTEEQGGQAATITQRWFRDDYRCRQDALLCEQPVADVQATVFRVLEHFALLPHRDVGREPN